MTHFTLKLPPVKLTPGPVWPTFESLRVQQAEALGSIKPGQVASLHGKHGRSWRIMLASDFDSLYQQAQMVAQAGEYVTDLQLAAQAYILGPSPVTQSILERAIERLKDVLSTPEVPRGR